MTYKLLLLNAQAVKTHLALQMTKCLIYDTIQDKSYYEV